MSRGLIEAERVEKLKTQYQEFSAVMSRGLIEAI